MKSAKVLEEGGQFLKRTKCNVYIQLLVELTTVLTTEDPMPWPMFTRSCALRTDGVFVIKQLFTAVFAVSDNTSPPQLLKVHIMKFERKLLELHRQAFRAFDRSNGQPEALTRGSKHVCAQVVYELS